VREACEAVGRDPADLTLTVNVAARFSDLGPAPHMQDERTPTAQIAEQLAGLAAAGVAEVMVDFRPLGVPALERVAEAVAQFRAVAPTG
jgi:hypothetical protein